MKEEIANLEKCGAGKVIGQSEVDALKKKNPSMRVIPSRWVSAYKTETRVRVRIVIVAKKHQQRCLCTEIRNF